MDFLSIPLELVFPKLIDLLRLTREIREGDWNPNSADQKAAWVMYVEMITRITTRPLLPEDGDEETALDSLHSLFQSTRDILKEYGRECKEFTKITVIILSQEVRPFTTKWHRKSREGAFEDRTQCVKFREELARLQEILREYTRSLAKLAGVEDLTNLLEE